MYNYNMIVINRRQVKYRKYNVDCKWAKLVRLVMRNSLRSISAKIKDEEYAKRRMSMAIMRSLLIFGRATPKTYISNGIRFTKLIGGSVGSLHKEHKDSVAMNLIFRKNMPNRAFIKVMRYILPSHMRRVAEQVKWCKNKLNSIDQKDMNLGKKQLGAMISRGYM